MSPIGPHLITHGPRSILCVFIFYIFFPCDEPPSPPECCLPHLAGHLNPAVSAFALSWKQQCDRPWVGVRDELVGGWGGGSRIFFFLQRPTGGCGVGAGGPGLERDGDGRRRAREGGCFGTGEEEPECVPLPSPPAGTLLLCAFADLESVDPSLRAESGSRLVNEGPSPARNRSGLKSAAGRRASKTPNAAVEVHGRSDQLLPVQVTCCKVHIDPLELNDIGAACRAPGGKVPSAGAAATEAPSLLFRF